MHIDHTDTDVRQPILEARVVLIISYVLEPSFRGRLLYICTVTNESPQIGKAAAQYSYVCIKRV